MSGYGGWQQGCNYESPAYDKCNNSGTFVLIVVLFILLIIVGSVFY
ncbi:YjcZ family sporulation protein [Solibacillus daqui]|nr:YjcZ family sporulation protein [Solibacillus daqui]